MNAVRVRILASYVAATEQLISLDNLKTKVENYRKQSNFEGKIKVIFATDAVSLTPEISISKKVSSKSYYRMRFYNKVKWEYLKVNSKKTEKYCKTKKK